MIQRSSGASASDDPVLRAAHEAVLEIGLGRLTLAEVARRAGVSRMTVYRRYDDLDRLVSALLVVEFSAVIADATDRARREVTGRGRLVREVLHVARRTAEHPLMRRILELDPEMLMPLVVDRLGSSHRIALTRLRELLEMGHSDGSIAPGDDEATALQVMSMAAIHVFSARAYDSVDPRGRRWTELERALHGYLRPHETESHGTESHETEPRPAERRPVEPRPAERRPVEPRPAEPHTADPDAPGGSR